MSQLRSLFKKLCCCESEGRKTCKETPSLLGTAPFSEGASSKTPPTEEQVIRMMQQLMGAPSSLTCNELALEYIAAAFKQLCVREGKKEPSPEQFSLLANALADSPPMLELKQVFSQKPTPEAKQRAFELGRSIAQTIYDDVFPSASNPIEEVS
eukprot:Gregarina_sp_Poly_1__8488@NODE_4_length_26097_cov_247_784211_g3_i0_p15_GENE_NODE_4_length_26097_cov_247_784211_g3_i0NODE_4_length_26097_cov_247_784211_g3_i0_p15_ORF_typecomplete_len154_score30_31UPF0154/PF03672_13/0_16_NODE_4_length_26097_cov_247_784211_g3_i075598020